LTYSTAGSRAFRRSCSRVAGHQVAVADRPSAQAAVTDQLDQGLCGAALQRGWRLNSWTKQPSSLTTSSSCTQPGCRSVRKRGCPRSRLLKPTNTTLAAFRLPPNTYTVCQHEGVLREVSRTCRTDRAGARVVGLWQAQGQGQGQGRVQGQGRGRGRGRGRDRCLIGVPCQ
jgi:hypothetical protein